MRKERAGPAAVGRPVAAISRRLEGSERALGQPTGEREISQRNRGQEAGERWVGGCCVEELARGSGHVFVAALGCLVREEGAPALVAGIGGIELDRRLERSRRPDRVGEIAVLEEAVQVRQPIPELGACVRRVAIDRAGERRERLGTALGRAAHHLGEERDCLRGRGVDWRHANPQPEA